MRLCARARSLLASSRPANVKRRNGCEQNPFRYVIKRAPTVAGRLFGRLPRATRLRRSRFGRHAGLARGAACAFGARKPLQTKARPLTRQAGAGVSAGGAPRSPIVSSPPTAAPKRCSRSLVERANEAAPPRPASRQSSRPCYQAAAPTGRVSLWPRAHRRRLPTGR